MKLAVFAIFGASSSLVHARSEVEVFQRGKSVGTGTYKSVFLPDGSKRTQIHLAISSNGNPTVIDRTIELDRLGQQRSESNVVSGGGRKVVTSARFAPVGDVTLIEGAGAQTRTTAVRFARIGSRKDESEMWIPKRPPGSGYWINFVSYRLEQRAWVVVRATYLGLKPVTIDGRIVKAHQIEQVQAGNKQTIWLDDAGEMLQFVSGETRLVRKWH